MRAETCCPVCGGPAFPVLEQKAVPVHQNLVFAVQSAAMQIARGDLTLCVCDSCGFVFNVSFDETKLQYGNHYDNTQMASPFFQSYTDSLVRRLIVDLNVQNSRIVEVGCGKGDFLKALVTAQGANNTGVGFDPSYDGPPCDLDGRLRFERRFYDEHCSEEEADVVICRHVIEHVPDPVPLLKAIRKALVNSSQARLFFETPDLGWILRHETVWDLFYEHCSYFTAESLVIAFEVAGFSVTQIESQFGGQYLWLEAANHPPQQFSKPALGTAAAMKQFVRVYSQTVREWRTMIQAAASQSRLALWGAGAKGVTFANLVDPQRNYITCVVDLNVLKQGGFLPGTGHPIVSDTALTSFGIDAIVVLNPNYAEEIHKRLAVSGLPIQIINLGAR